MSFSKQFFNLIFKFTLITGRLMEETHMSSKLAMTMKKSSYDQVSVR